MKRTLKMNRACVYIETAILKEYVDRVGQCL